MGVSVAMYKAEAYAVNGQSCSRGTGSVGGRWRNLVPGHGSGIDQPLLLRKQGFTGRAGDLGVLEP